MELRAAADAKKKNNQTQTPSSIPIFTQLYPNIQLSTKAPTKKG